MPATNHDSTLSGFFNTVSYRNASSTKRDISTALSNYRGLTPKLEHFTFNDGSRRRLVCLDGTIPVPYKGANYNIPVVIWILDTHPTNAPLCFVRPTAEMSIQMSRHVDQNGKIYLPYLHEWKPSESDLLGLIQMCIVVFMEKPPVYARSSAAPAQPPPPPPANYQPPPSYNNYQAFPPPPVYPPVAAQPATGYPPPAQPPYPPYPPQTSNNTPPYPAYPPTTTNASNNNNNSNSGTITQEHIRASCLSAVEDKLRRLLREEFEAKQAELESLSKQKDDLNGGKNQITQALAQLDQTENQLDMNIAMLKSTSEELDNALSKLEESKEMNVDDAVTTTAPLYKQLLNAFAEEAAIEDSIYYLGEGLRRGVIDCETFLKNVRKLSRKQFQLRFIMIKCREKAGLRV